MSATPRYRFADVEIDLDAREIRRAGVLVDVEAKVFDLIELLLLSRDRAMSKNELVGALWGDRPVTDAALSQQLRKARRALGDDGDAQRVIRTVHGRGLRWVAEVSLAEPRQPIAAAPVVAVAPAHASPTMPTPARRRRWIAAAACAAILLVAAGLLSRYTIRAAGDGASRVRIAVLPLVDGTGEPDLGWTRTGLMGLMTSLLGQDGKIEVVPADNVQATMTRSDAPDLDLMRRAFGATHFVAGSLRRVGPIYELDLRLVAAGAAERHETLHASTPAPLAVDAVARVRRWLDLTPLPDVRGTGIASPFLAEAYARGLDAQLHGDHAGAKKYFEICLDHDPGLAWPRLGLAIAQGASGEQKLSEDNANKVAAAARERNDRDLLVPALRQLASLAYHRGDLEGAAAHLDEALQQLSAADQPLAMTDLLIAYGSIDDDRGDFKRSRAQFEEALRLARETGNRRGEASVLVNLASLDNGAGDAAAAAAMLREGLDAARAAGDAYLEGTTLGNLGATEANQGHLLSAIALLKQGLAIARARNDTNLIAMIGMQLAWTLAPFGRDDEVRALAHKIVALGESAKNPYWQAEAHWVLAGLAARRHEWPQAFTEFDRARALYSADGMTRNLAPVLAEMIAAASDAGDAERAREANAAFRTIAAADPGAWNAWLPMLDAQLRKADGDALGAAAELTHLLDGVPPPRDPTAQSALFQLGRWQLALGRPDALLARPEWKRLLDEHPDAIALRVEALRNSGDTAAADAEQKRLDRLLAAPELDLDPAWLAAE